MVNKLYKSSLMVLDVIDGQRSRLGNVGIRLHDHAVRRGRQPYQIRAEARSLVEWFWALRYRNGFGTLLTFIVYLAVWFVALLAAAAVLDFLSDGNLIQTLQTAPEVEQRNIPLPPR